MTLKAFGEGLSDPPSAVPAEQQSDMSTCMHTHVVETERQIEMTDGEKLGNEVVAMKKTKKNNNNSEILWVWS